jgi:Tat protein secretion system quality control protein TatD with DNase activity
MCSTLPATTLIVLTCHPVCSLEAMAHPRCVGWGEIGLDYHYDNSPRNVQQAVFTRQLKRAVELGKPLTIHTREAEEDTERILKSEVPSDHKVLSLMHLTVCVPPTHCYFCLRFTSIASLTRLGSHNDCWNISRTFTLASQVQASLVLITPS